VAACEAVELAFAVRALGECETCKVEARGPAIGALKEPPDALVAQAEAQPVVQQRGGFQGAEAEVARRELVELEARPQTRERERRVGPGRQHDTQVGRAAVEQDGELFVHFTVAEPVVVLEHEHDRPRQRRDRIDQLREDGFGDARRPDARHRRALPGRFRSDAAHRFADASHRGIAETTTRVIHARITTSRVRGGNLAP
jgi:hypothetical protein